MVEFSMLSRQEMKSQNNSSIINLPKDIIEEEILPRLPVKLLLRFRCISKSWRSSIDSEGFIKTHFQNSTHHRVIYRSNLFGLKQCSLHTFLNNSCIGLPSPSDDPTINRSYVVGCCNGLFCLYSQNKGCFLLWNPATKISFELPEIERATETGGFGYDAASGAYKVFAVVFHRNGKKIGKVYSSKTNSWTKIEGVGGHFLGHYGKGMFVCGRIHWLNPRGIDSFDLKSEVFGKIDYPFDLEMGRKEWLGEIKGCLSLVCDDNERRELCVWIMKEDSWLKVVKVPFVFFSLSAQVEIASEGVVLLIYETAFVALDRDDAVLSEPKKTGYIEMWRDMFSSSYETTHFYVESLVSPVPEANVLTVCAIEV